MLGDEERAELLERVRALIERWGWKTYVTAPILEPTDRFFPDPYTADIRGVRTVARRLLEHIGLGHLEVDAHGVEQAADDPLAQTQVFLADLDERALSLEVWGIGPAEEVPLVLAHDVARAYRVLRSGPMRAEHPYRAPAFEDDERPDEEEEEEVSLTAAYLGFALLVALGAHRYKATGEISGYVAITRWVHLCLGALAPDEACFLLAAQGVARGVDDATIARWRKTLGVNQRKPFGAFVRDLRADREGLLEALGLPHESKWPAPRDEHVEPFEDDGWRPAAPEEDEDAPSHPVFRMPQHRGWTLAVGTGAGGFVGFLGLAFADAPELIWPTLVGGPLAAVAAFFLGKTLRRTDTCSMCEAKLAPGVERCPVCRGVVRGELQKGESHLAALDRLKDVTAFGGTIAEAQEDADPRYVKTGVKCPSCGWIPDGEAHWSCDSCHGEPFNTFEHGGECPECSEIFEETLCPRCDHLAAYEWWWPADESGV